MLLLAATLVAASDGTSCDTDSFCNACPPPDPTCTRDQLADEDVVKCCVFPPTPESQRICTPAEQDRSKRCCPR